MDKAEEALPPLQVAVQPPINPMLAQLTRELPTGEGWLYEPKWDGFRALVFWDGNQVVIQSRDLKPLTRYFPELETGLRELLPPGTVVDGEIVIAGPDGLDFDALLLRIHPAASRVAMLAKQTPTSFVAFDLLADASGDLRQLPQVERRQKLERIVASPKAPLHLTPATTDRTTAARWFERFEGAGLDGVVAKRLDSPYVEGERVMLKVKHQRTADCVVIGFRFHRGHEGVAVGSLLLGLYDDEGTVHHVGFTSSFKTAERREILKKLEPYRDESERKRWEQQFGIEFGSNPNMQSRWTRGQGKVQLEWQPLRPELVCEVAFDHWQGTVPGTPSADERGWLGRGRFRHGTTFLRWRPDKPPRDCTFDQLTFAVPIELHEVFGEVIRGSA
jgi:ATP-dependent DNA ligase